MEFKSANLNQLGDLCNGTRLVTTHLGKWSAQARNIFDTYIGDLVFIPRIIMTSSETKWLFKVKRK